MSTLANAPDGWMLVPVKPTPWMIDAGWIDKEDVSPEEIYAAMLAAAPPAPVASHEPASVSNKPACGSPVGDKAPPVESGQELAADFAQSLPGGKLDDSTYSKIEDALDRLDAPMTAEDGRWLSLHERIAALTLAPPPEPAKPEMVEGPFQPPQLWYDDACMRLSFGAEKSEPGQVRYVRAGTPPAVLAAGGVVSWAVERWKAEVGLRPLNNIHRRTLDDTWRQVIRQFGGDPDALLGADHDCMVALAPPPKAPLDLGQSAAAEMRERCAVAAEGVPLHADPNHYKARFRVEADPIRRVGRHAGDWPAGGEGPYGRGREDAALAIRALPLNQEA